MTGARHRIEVLSDRKHPHVPVSAVMAAVSLFAPFAALAHVEDGVAGGLLSGLTHPVSGLDHVLAIAMLIVAFFAVLHGHAHGTEMAPDQNAMLYSIGFVIATGLLHAAGIALGLIHRWDTGRVVLRAAGSVVLAGGLYFLWSAVA